jgi:hypothetical protein
MELSSFRSRLAKGCCSSPLDGQDSDAILGSLDSRGYLIRPNGSDFP